MIITVKILQGDECAVEVSSTSSVSFVKQLVARELDVPVPQQRLVFKGRTLSDSQCLSDYNIAEGSKLHLIVRKLEGGKDESVHTKSSRRLWNEMEKILLKHFMPSDAEKVLDQFKKDYNQSVGSWSLDDIERIAQLNQDLANNGPSTSQS